MTELSSCTIDRAGARGVAYCKDCYLTNQGCSKCIIGQERLQIFVEIRLPNPINGRQHDAAGVELFEQDQQNQQALRIT
jgi:hypothetical protein